MSNQKICQKCWAAASAEAFVCPACGHDVLVEPDTIATATPRIEENETKAEAFGLPMALIVTFGVLLLLGVGWWLKGAFVGPAIAPGDFTGRWVAADRTELAAFYQDGAPAEVGFSFWRNGPYLEHDIPFGGPTRFDASVENNVIKGGTLVGDIARPVTLALSRDRKILTLNFTLREGSAGPDVVVHATRP